MKRSFRKILCLFLVMLIIPLFSLPAWAEDYSAELRSLHYDIALQEDGSAYITETREIVFDGDHEFTRYGGYHIFTAPREFCDWQVSIDGMPVPQLDEPDNENRPENTFAVEDNDEGNIVYIYFRQQGSGTRIFQISYCVENAVKLYSDVGVFSWNLTEETEMSDISTLTATLTVPEGVPEEDFLIWAHGPHNGSFDKQPDGSAFLQVDNVALGTIVDIRSTLPAYCFYGGWEQQGEALPEIMAEEQELSDSANAKREEEERRKAESDAYWEESLAQRYAWEAEHPILYFIEDSCREIRYLVEDFLDFLYESIPVLIGILFVLPIIWFLLIALTSEKVANIRRRYNQKKFRNKPTQLPRYYRGLPDDRPAPSVDRLVHFYDGKSDVSRQLSATLLELNLKNLIHFQTIAGDVTILLNEQLGEELFPPPAPQESAEPAQEHTPDYQEILWEFLLNAADGSGRIAMEDLKNYIKDNQKAALNFRNSFEGAVEREFTAGVNSRDVERYSSGGGKRRLIVAAVAAIIAMLIYTLSGLYYGVWLEDVLITGLVTFVVAVIIQLLLRALKKYVETPSFVLDQQGEDDLALWQAFGRFLDDFTTFDEKELPEFPVWRKYMVYAVALGRGQKVAKALALKYPEAVYASAGTDTFDDDMYRMLQDMALYHAMDSVGREVAESKEPSSSSDTSWNDTNWSDGGGGGGGFSDSGGGSDIGSGGSFVD